MTRRIAITGATGFLGRHVLTALQADGWQPRVLVRKPMPGKTGNEPDFLNDMEKIERITGDLDDREALERLVKGVDAVLHMAGVVKAATAQAFLSVNALGTERLAKAWRQEAPAARFVLVSSMAAREPKLSDYAFSKAEAEKRLRARAGDGDWRIVRPAAIYGPGDRETLTIFKMADAAFQPMLNAAGARVCLVHARDVAGAIVATLNDPEPHSVREIIDARSDGYRWDELALAAARALGRAPRPYRVPASLLRITGYLGALFSALSGRAAMISPGKVREILHPDWSSSDNAEKPIPLWKPQITLNDGFCETVAWYREAGWLKPRRLSRAMPDPHKHSFSRSSHQPQ